jgi:hypothetical protein
MKTVLRNAVALATMLTICTSLAWSQEQQTPSESGRSPKIGVKLGGNLSNLRVDNVEDEKLKLGLNLGLFAKIPVAKGFSIQPELLYSSKGTKLTTGGLLDEGEYRFNLNYVEVPVLAVINLARNFNLHVGGYGAYLASANIKQLEGDGGANEITDLDEDDFNRFDYGLVGGLGVDVANFTIGARYDLGLKGVGEAGALSDSKNSAFSLYIGLGF